MPSHIFTRLGLWQESIESNRASAAVAKEEAHKTNPGAVSYDALHAMDYMMYAYLQRAQDLEAKRLLDEINAIRIVDGENLASAYAFTAIPARYALERRRWADAASLTPYPSNFPWSRFPQAEAVTYFARALGAARSGDAAGARKEIEELQFLHDSLVAVKQGYWAEQVEVQRRVAAAWLARLEGKNQEALQLMRAAADLEDSTEKHPVTPGPIMPARELLGELLLELNEPANALREFEASQRVEANRFKGLYGAAKAAERSGNPDSARALYGQLLAVCNEADTDRPELLEARAFLAKK